MTKYKKRVSVIFLIQKTKKYNDRNIKIHITENRNYYKKFNLLFLIFNLFI